MDNIWANNNNGYSRIRIVRPSGVTGEDASRIVRPSGVTQDCGALVSHYQTLHGHLMAESNPERRSVIDGQMRAILNHMHSISCGGNGQANQGSIAVHSPFTGTTCGIGAEGLTSPTSMDSGAVMNNVFVAHSASTDVFQGRKNDVWGSASDALCGVSAVDMTMVDNGAWGTLMPIAPMAYNGIPLCSTTVCTPSPVCTSSDTKSTAQDAGVILPDVPASKAPAPAPYVKPTFWAWLTNGMKA